MTETGSGNRLSSSAPGKLVLAGEYAVLDGAPGICMAVDRRARISIAATGNDYHTVSAPGFSSAHGKFRDVDGGLEWLAASDDFTLVDEVWRAVNGRYSAGLSLVLDTSEFVDTESRDKFGIGSSAALTVALAAALCELAQTDVDASTVAFAAHAQFQGGYGSGIDIACSHAGGLIEYRMGEGTSHRLSWPKGLAYALLWSGVPADTGDKLKRFDRSQQRPSRNALAHWSRRIADVWRRGSARAILAQYRDYIRVLREFSIDHGLGIFDAGHAELADLALAADVIYKPCGAGGGDVGIVLADNEAAITRFAADALARGFRDLKINVDTCGVQVDRGEC